MKGEQERRLPPPLLRQIDAICYEFEQAWRAQQNPRIEDYLAAVRRRRGRRR